MQLSILKKTPEANIEDCLRLQKADLDSVRTDFLDAPWCISNIFDELDDATRIL